MLSRAGDCATIYTKLRSITFSDFTPSRVTRTSSNPYLQEHDPIYSTVAVRRFPHPVLHEQYSAPCIGTYITLDFSDCRQRSKSAEEASYSTNTALSPSSRVKHFSSNSQNRCKQLPELTEEGIDSCPAVLQPRLQSPMALDVMQVDKRPTSFAIAVNDHPIIFPDGSSSTQETAAAAAPIALEFAVRESRAGRTLQPSEPTQRSPPPLPPKGIQPCAMPAGFEEEKEERAPPVERENHYTLALSPNQNTRDNFERAVLSTTHQTSPSPPPSSRMIVTTTPLMIGEDTSPCRHHTPSSPKPIPPPRTRRLSSNSKSVPDLLSAVTSEHRQDSTPRQSPWNFLDSSAGDEYGRFSVDYLGSREIDQFVGIVDECAQQLMNCKPPVRATQVVAYVSTERVRLAPPKPGPLFKSLAVRNMLTVAQCVKNKRIVGVVVWKPRTKPVCHLLRSSDQLVSNNFMEALSYVIENLDSESLKKTEMSLPPEVSQARHSFSSNSSSDSDHLAASPPPVDRKDLQSISAIHIGGTKVGKIQSVTELIQRVLAESQPSLAREVSVWLSQSQVQLVDKTYQWEFIYAMHDTSCIQAIGVYPEDRRYIGYFVQEKQKPLMGHVLWCNTAATVASMLSFLRDACQQSFKERGYESNFKETVTRPDGRFSHSQQPEARSIISRLRSLTSLQSSDNHSPTHSSFQSYMGSPKSSFIFDYTRKRKDTVAVPTASSGMELGEEDYVRFSVNYVGSATLDPPFTPQSITQAMQMFNQNGVAAGMAAVPKNTISMHVSALGINLSDKKHKLFVSRNYPRKQIAGYCVHKMDEHYFGVATRRPGFDDLKVHVFMQVHASEPVSHIMDSIKFWLQIDPLI